MENTMRYETSISTEYVRNWNQIQAIKEFLQNLVFAKDCLGDDITIDYTDSSAILHNHISGFKKNSLLLGEGEQKNYSTTPGGFSEGMKLAMLTSLRNDKTVVIQTNGFTVVPKIEPSTICKDTNVLVYYVTDTDLQEGTKVTIECDKEELDVAITYFGSLSNKKVSWDKSVLLTDKSEMGNIYVNGVKITHRQDCIYGYNLTNKNLMNRDRSILDDYSLRLEIGKLLSTELNQDVFNEVLRLKLENSSTLESISTIETTPQNKPLILKAVEKCTGKPISKVCVSSGGDTDTVAKYKGLVVLANLRYNTIDLLSELGIKSAKTMLSDTNILKRVHRKPKGDSSMNLAWAKILIKLYYADYGTVKVTDNLVDSYGNLCYGVYNRVEDVIWLDSSILDSKKNTFTTLLHETIHKVTGYNDNTTEFTTAWEDATYKILMRGKAE